MRIKEILAEAISYTTHRDRIISYVSQVIKLTTNRIIESQSQDQNIISVSNLGSTIRPQLRNELKAGLEAALKDIAVDITDVPQADVQFKFMNTSGAANNLKVDLTMKYIDQITIKIWQHLETVLLDNNLVDYNEKSDIDYLNLTKFQQHFKQHPYWVDESLQPIINGLVMTFIHELVHVRQHGRQPGRKTEYRSYIMNKSKFYAAMNRIHDGIVDEIVQLAHASSPQEIPARAHDTAIEFINGIVDDNPTKMQATKYHIRSLKYWIENMDPRYIVDNTYRQFNKPGTKEYKIYKKFMKIVVQEINSYRQYLSQILAKLEQEYKDYYGDDYIN